MVASTGPPPTGSAGVLKVLPAALAGVVGRVRTTLVELVSELVATVPADELPTGSQVDQAVHVHVAGRKNTVSVSSSSPGSAVGEKNTALRDSIASDSAADAGWWTWPRKVAAGVGGLVAVAAGIVTVVHDWPF